MLKKLQLARKQRDSAKQQRDALLEKNRQLQASIAQLKATSISEPDNTREAGHRHHVFETEKALKEKNTELRQGLKGARRQRDKAKGKAEKLSAQVKQLQAEVKEAGKHHAVLQPAAALLNDLCSRANSDAVIVEWVRKNGRLPAQRLRARSLAHALAEGADMPRLGSVCNGVHCVAERFPATALASFRQAPLDYVLRLAPGEYLQSLLETGHPEGAQLAARILAGEVPADPAALFTCAKAAAAARLFDLAEEFAKASWRDGGPSDPEEKSHLDWMLGEFGRRRAARERTVSAESGEIRIGVIDYKMLDYKRTSSNLGDYVQTMAMLSNLLRFTGVTYRSPDEGFAGLLAEMAGRVREEFRIPSPSARVLVETVHRDAASAKRFAGPTWVVAFGWYMHPEFRSLYDFPFEENVRPIFISFHINDRAMLTPEAVDYLLKYAPIGCRDWSTVYALREYGVPAFFSGCLTTTIGKLFAADPGENAGERSAYVDCRPLPGEARTAEHSVSTQAGLDVRHNDITTNLRAAAEALEKYREFRRIVTSRLHCYLPCRALGLEVDFRPRNRADVRFEGLLDLDSESFHAIREGIESKLAAVFSRILSGATETEVYGEWRKICEQDLVRAEEHCRRIPPFPAPSFDPVVQARQLAAAASHRVGCGSARETAIPVAFACDGNMAAILPAALESAWRNCSRRLHFHIMGRGLPEDFAAKMQSDFGDVADVSFYAFDNVDYGDRLRMLVHTTVSTMDRLLLPDLLQHLDKIIYLDADIIVRGDLAELWATDISGVRLAGKASNYEAWKYVHKLVARAASTLQPEASWELRRRLSGAGPLQVRAFNAGVLVLNLAMMRQDDFAALHVPYIEQFAMNDQDALNVYARGSWVQLDPAWNAVPSQDDITDAKILHFAGPTKPWESMHILGKEDFTSYLTQYRRRTHAGDDAPQPPNAGDLAN